MSKVKYGQSVRAVALFLAVMWVAVAAPALASPALVTLNFSYFPSESAPPDPTFAGSMLGGTVSFYTQVLQAPPEPVRTLSFSALAVGGNYETSFVLDNTGRLDETLLFSFQGLAGGFGAFAFDTLRSAGDNAPPEPVNYLIGMIPAVGPPDPVHVAGVIVAYDAPVQVGTWEVTVSAVPEPETYAMLLAGLGLLGFTARRRK